jgi:hypothetical protein
MGAQINCRIEKGAVIFTVLLAIMTRGEPLKPVPGFPLRFIVTD